MLSCVLGRYEKVEKIGSLLTAISMTRTTNSSIAKAPSRLTRLAHAVTMLPFVLPSMPFSTLLCLAYSGTKLINERDHTPFSMVQKPSFASMSISQSIWQYLQKVGERWYRLTSYAQIERNGIETITLSVPTLQAQNAAC